MPRSFIREFISFLKEYKVISLAVAFVMGSASTNLVGSMVNDIIMPIAEPFMSGEKWREAVLSVGPVHIAYGSFVAQAVNFLVLAFVVFVVVKKIIQLEKENK